MFRWLPGVLVATLLPAPYAWAAGSAAKGRDIAVEHCSHCHVIPDHNPMAGDDIADILAYARTIKGK